MQIDYSHSITITHVVHVMLYLCELQVICNNSSTYHLVVCVCFVVIQDIAAVVHAGTSGAPCQSSLPLQVFAPFETRPHRHRINRHPIKSKNCKILSIRNPCERAADNPMSHTSSKRQYWKRRLTIANVSGDTSAQVSSTSGMSRNGRLTSRSTFAEDVLNC